MSTDSERKLPIVPIIIIVAAIVLFAIGWWRGGAAPKAQVEQLTTELSESRDSTTAAQRQRDQARAGMTLREAQVALLQANMELDRRNFGTANEHIERAGERLATIDAATLTLDEARLEALREELAHTNLNLATDLAEQRSHLNRLAAEINDIAATR
jgi:hypothetical protein